MTATKMPLTIKKKLLNKKNTVDAHGHSKIKKNIGGASDNDAVGDDDDGSADDNDSNTALNMVK